MKEYAFCDKTLSYPVRVKDLVDRLTLEEKVTLSADKAGEVKRFNIPAYRWWSEALHGVSDVGGGSHFDKDTVAATNFPVVILSAASFNETLWKSIGQVVSNEARALHNVGMAGLTFWSPNINPSRDPRWGRITETPGEDPFLIGRYAANYVRGLQDVQGQETSSDPNSRPLKVAACCKHFVAYDVDNWNGTDRYHFDAKVTERDMRETFAKPFEMCVKEGDVASVMCSYNRVNGIPTCADPNLLRGIVRDKWNLHGYIVADCDSVEVMVNSHKFLNDTPEDAVAQTIKAGLDLDCGNYTRDHLLSTVKSGKVSVGDVDNALKNLYTVMMRLGWFDGSPNYASLGRKDVCTPQNLELSIDAGRQSIVLLKNDQNFLPMQFNKTNPTIAVAGPHGNATKPMLGNYALEVPCRYTTPLDAIKDYGNVRYSPGCADVLCAKNDGIDAAVQVARGSDATFVFVGLSLAVEAESLDRKDLKLPGFQEELINKILSDANIGPIVLVILSAGGVDISAFKDNPKVPSIIWAGYPGADGGKAIADIIFGKYNPAGRLPLTWYPSSYIDKFPLTSMPLRPVPEQGFPGRTYRFYNGSTLYPFGYGLSYTTFSYSIKNAPNQVYLNIEQYQKCKPIVFTDGIKPECPATLSEETKCTEMITVNVGAQNTGKRDGDTILILYTAPPPNIAGTPIKRVVAFKRVFVKAGMVSNVAFKLNPCEIFSIVTDDAYELLPFGDHTIIVGNGAEAVSSKIAVKFKTYQKVGNHTIM